MASMPFGLLFGAQNGLFDPFLVVLHFCIDPGDVATATTYAETDNADLKPLSIFLAYQGTTSVSLGKQTENSLESLD